MPQPDEGGIEAGLGRAAQPPTPTSSASNSSSRLQQPSPRSGSSCSAAELRQLEWDSSFDFTARYQPSRADGEPTERSEPRTAGPLVTVTQQAQTVSVPAAVFAETEVNLVVASADSSRSDRTGSTVITLRRQVSFPTISLKRSAGALDGLRGLTILFEGGEQPDTAGSEASFCSLAPTEPQQPAASRHASRLSQQTEYASLSERLSSASAASHPAPPQPPQQQTGRAAMSRPPRTPAPPPPPLASRAPPSIEKCARWLARHELQVGHGDGTGTGPTAAAATIAAADGAGRARGAWRSRIQPCSSQDRVVSAERNKPQPDYRPVVTPAEPRRAADTGTKRSPATARKALSDPLGGSAQSAGAAGSAAAAVRPQPAAKSRSAHAGTAAGMTRQQHAESLARRPRPPPVAAAASRSYTETATAPSVPSLHYLDSAESDELIRRWRQDRKDFYQLAYLRRGDSDVLSPADDSGFSSSVLTQRHVSEQQVQVFTVSAVKTTPSAVPAASAASKLGPAQGDSAPVAAGAATAPTQQEQVTVLVPPRDEPPSSAPNHQTVPAATPPVATPPQTSLSTAAGPVPSRQASAAASSSRGQRPQTAPAGGRPRPVTGSSSRRLGPQPSGVVQRRSAAAPAGSVRFSPSTQSAVGRASAAPVTPRPSAAAVRAPPSRLGRTRSSTFTMPEKDDGPQNATAATMGSNSGVPATKSSANSGAPGSVSTLKPNPSGASNGGAMVGGPTGRPSGKVPAVGSTAGTSGSIASGSIAGVRSGVGASTPVVRPSAGGVGSSPVRRPSAGGVASSPAMKPSAEGVRSSPVVRPSAGGVVSSLTTKTSAGGAASSPSVGPSVGGVGLSGEAGGSSPSMRPSTGAAGSTPVVKPSSGPGRSTPAVRPSQGSAVSASPPVTRGSTGRVPSVPSTPATAATDSPRSTSPSRVDSSRSSRSNLVSSTSTGSPRRLSSSPDRRRSSLASSAVPPAGSGPTVRPSTSPTVRPSAVRRGSLRASSVLDTASRMERSPTAGSVAAVRTQSRGRGAGAAGSTAASPSVGVVPQAPRPLSAQPEPNMRRNQPPPRRYSFTPSTAGVGGSRTAAGGGVAFQASRGGETGLRPSRSSTGTGGQTYRRESAPSGEQIPTNPSRHSSAHVTRPVSGPVGTAARSNPAVRPSQHTSSSSVVPGPSPEMHARKSLVNREIESGSLPRLRSISASRSPDPCQPPLRCDETPPPGSPERSGAESDEGDGDGDRDWAGDTNRGRNMDRNRGRYEDDGDEYRDREKNEDEQRPARLGTAERQWSREDTGPSRGYSGSFRRSVDEAQLPLVRDTIRDYEVRSRSVSRERVPVPRPEPRPEMVTRLTLELETDREPGAEPELGAEGDDQGVLPESDTELDTELEPSAAAVRYSTDGCAAGDEESGSDGDRQTPAVPPLTGLSPPDSRRPADPDPYHPGQWRQQHEPAPRRPHTRSRIPVRRPTPDTSSPRQPAQLQPAQRQQLQATPQRPQYASYELTVLAERSAGRQRSPPPRRVDDYQPGRQARPGGPPRRPRPPPQGCPDRRPPSDHPRASRGHSDTTIHPRASAAANVSPRLTGTPAGVGGGSQRSVRSVRSAPARRGPSTPRSDRSTSSSEAVYTLGFSEAELRQARLVRRQPAGGRPLRLTLDGDGALEGGRAVVRRLQHTQTQTDEFAHVSSLLQLDLFPCQRDAPGRGHADT